MSKDNRIRNWTVAGGIFVLATVGVVTLNGPGNRSTAQLELAIDMESFEALEFQNAGPGLWIARVQHSDENGTTVYVRESIDNGQTWGMDGDDELSKARTAWLRDQFENRESRESRDQ